MGKYYSKRNKPSTDMVTLEFWRAFRSLIQDKKEEGWLSQKFGGLYWRDDEFYWSADQEKINRKMVQELGKDYFPLSASMPDQEIIFDVIEFFFNYVSIPNLDANMNIKGWDAGKAKYQYTIDILMSP